MKKVLVIGSTVCDIILYLDHLPTTQEDLHPTRQETRIGGCAFNVAHVLSHLKINYDFVSPIGTGVYGDFIKNEIKKHGVKTELFVNDENGSCLCLVEKSGERTFLSMHGAEYRFDPVWLNKYNLDEYRYGYLCGLEVEDQDGQKLIDTVCNLDIQFLFAPGPRILKIPQERMKQLLNHGVMLHLNDLEAMKYTQAACVEEAAEQLYQQTNNLVIITCGEKGCYLKAKEGVWIPSAPAEVKDTIGAGDSHAGAFLAALAHGNSVEQSAAFANLVAGKVVSTSASILDESIYQQLRTQFK